MKHSCPDDTGKHFRSADKILIVNKSEAFLVHKLQFQQVEQQVEHWGASDRKSNKREHITLEPVHQHSTDVQYNYQCKQ